MSSTLPPPDVLPLKVRVVEEGGHVARFVEIVGPIPVRWHAAPPRPRVRLNPVNDLATETGA